MPAVGLCAMADFRKGTVSVLWILGLVYSILGAVFGVVGCVLCLVLGKELRLLGVIFGGIGGVFLVLGLIFLGVEFRKRKKAEELIASGRYVWGTISDWRVSRSVEVCGRHPIVLLVRCVDGRGQEHVFRSPGLWIAGGPRLIGKQVRVYYGDPDFRNYYVAVDCDSLMVSGS